MNTESDASTETESDATMNTDRNASTETGNDAFPETERNAGKHIVDAEMHEYITGRRRLCLVARAVTDGLR